MNLDDRIRSRAWLTALPVGVLICALTLDVFATDEPAVPATMQAQLLAKVAAYDRNLPQRAKGMVRIALVYDAKDPVSARTANRTSAAFDDLGAIAGLPHTQIEMPFESAEALRVACRTQQLSVVFLSPGLSGFTEAIRHALDGVDVLSATSTPGDVEHGIVLGFDTLSGRPKLLFNLPQARSQHVDVSANALSVMTVYR